MTVWRDTEPRRRVERTVALAEAVRTMPERRASAVLGYLVFGASIRAIARHLEISPSEAKDLVFAGISNLRHPSRSSVLRDYLDDGVTITIDPELRSLIRRLRLEEVYDPACGQCGSRPAAARPCGAGRPRRFCSNACRQRAYRARRKTERPGAE